MCGCVQHVATKIAAAHSAEIKVGYRATRGNRMCLGIPMKIIALDGLTARCEAKGVQRDVSLFMLQDDLPTPGDYVIVHVGYALQRITETEARNTWDLFDEMVQGA